MTLQALKDFKWYLDYSEIEDPMVIAKLHTLVDILIAEKEVVSDQAVE